MTSRTKPDASAADRAEPSEANAGAANGPRAMGRVLRLFDLLARRRDGMILSDLSLALKVPKSTLLSSLRPLVTDGYLLNEGHLYRLGPTAFRLAGTIMSAWSMPDIIRHHVRELGRATGESVGFAIADWEIGQAIYTDAVNSTQPVHYAMRVGIRAPLYASAAGRVLLAFASEDKRRNYLARAPFKSLTSDTRTSRKDILENLGEIVERGYCASFGEMLKDTAAVAAPVLDANDIVIGALMVAAPLSRMHSNFDYLLDNLLRCSRQASGIGSGSGSGNLPSTDPE